MKRVWQVLSIGYGVARLSIVALFMYSIVAANPEEVLAKTQPVYGLVLIYSSLHLFSRFGILRGIGVLIFSFCVPYFMEYLGTTTGLIFGSYHYTDKVQPQLAGGVPFFTISYWRFIIYSVYCWTFLVFQLEQKQPFKRRALAGCCGAAMLVGLDLAIDPVEVTRGIWTWTQDGCYFGIPLSNFLGWFITALVVLLPLVLVRVEQGRTRGVQGTLWIYHLPSVDVFIEGFCYLLLSIQLASEKPSLVLTGVIGCGALTPFFVAGISRLRSRFINNH